VSFNGVIIRFSGQELLALGVIAVVLMGGCDELKTRRNEDGFVLTNRKWSHGNQTEKTKLNRTLLSTFVIN